MGQGHGYTGIGTGVTGGVGVSVGWLRRQRTLVSRCACLVNAYLKTFFLMSDGALFYEAEPAAGAAQHDGTMIQEEHDAAWQRMLHQLVCYQMQHRHCYIPKGDRRHPQLAEWLEKQVKLFHKGLLSATKQRELKALGVDWDVVEEYSRPGDNTEARWEARFEELVRFQQQHGHLRITLKNQSSAGFLHWRDNQRIRFRNGVMPPEQKARLDAIGFEWVQPERLSPSMEEHNVALWESLFERLLAFREQHGHCQVPNISSADRLLARWVQRQRYHRRKNRLLAERQRRLEEVGFDWASDKLHLVSGWEARFEELVRFQQQHGHLRITLKNQSSAGLMHWRDNQRIRFRSGVMPPEQKARLDAIGFEWEQPERLSPAMEEHNVALWESLFERLLAFRQQHGHCQVPKGKGADHVLARWVRQQRNHHRLNTLLAERQRRLEEVGFDWASDKLHFVSGWEARFEELVRFQQQHGHLRITLKNQSSAGFLHWRDNQRIRLRIGTLKPEQKARLDAIGFEWEPPGRPNPT